MEGKKKDRKKRLHTYRHSLVLFSNNKQPSSIKQTEDDEELATEAEGELLEPITSTTSTASAQTTPSISAEQNQTFAQILTQPVQSPRSINATTLSPRSLEKAGNRRRTKSASMVAPIRFAGITPPEINNISIGGNTSNPFYALSEAMGCIVNEERKNRPTG